MTAPHAVGHVHLKVRDLERAMAFYTSVLGLEVAERHGNYVFLSWGQRHHDVALQGIGGNASGPGPGVGLYHAAFEVESGDAIREIAQKLDERGVDYVPVDHGISKALYFDDPDGNGIEIYLDTRDERGIERWQGRNERFDPESV